MIYWTSNEILIYWIDVRKYANTSEHSAPSPNLFNMYQQFANIWSSTLYDFTVFHYSKPRFNLLPEDSYVLFRVSIVLSPSTPGLLAREKENHNIRRFWTTADAIGQRNVSLALLKTVLLSLTITIYIKLVNNMQFTIHFGNLDKPPSYTQRVPRTHFHDCARFKERELSLPHDQTVDSCNILL